MAPLMGFVSAIGSAVATAAPLISAIAPLGAAVIQSQASNRQASTQASSQVESARIAAAQRTQGTPGSAVISGPQGPVQPGATRDIVGPGGPNYSGGGSRYNSAQALATAPSLKGTGSGFNAAGLQGQPQPGDTGVQ